MGYSYMMEHYLEIKEKEILVHVTSKPRLPSERSQTQKTTYCMVLSFCEESRKGKPTDIKALVFL